MDDGAAIAARSSSNSPTCLDRGFLAPMIQSRIALFIAFVCGVLMTQLPEYAGQYEQRLGGAVDELSAIVAQFDRESAAQGMSEKGGIERLHQNPDVFVQQRGDQMSEISARLARLQALQQMLKTSGPAERFGLIVTHYDSSIASRAFQSFQPAVPVSAEAFILGLIGFVAGGGIVHATGYSVKRTAARYRRPHPKTIRS